MNLSKIFREFGCKIMKYYKFCILTKMYVKRMNDPPTNKKYNSLINKVIRMTKFVSNKGYNIPHFLKIQNQRIRSTELI